MNQSQRPQVEGKGSVRRARAALENGRTPDMPPPLNLPSRPNAGRQGANPQYPEPRPKQPMPAALSTSRADGQGIGMTISRPTPAPQWPLATPLQSNPASRDAPPRGQTPQRPPRPSHVLSMLDSSRVQEPTPSFQYKAQHDAQYLGVAQSQDLDDEPTAANILSPNTTASKHSTVSSVGTIPDFPLPMPDFPPPMPASNDASRKSAALGPPPSSRRGPSSYYSNLSYVSPIVEESPRGQPSHNSYASSSAMPSNWRDDTFSDDDDEIHERYMLPEDTIPEEGRVSQQSNGDDGSEHNLIRSASLGRRGKPSVVSTKSAEKLGTGPQSLENTSKLSKMGVFDPMGARAAQMKAFAASHAEATNSRPIPRPIQTDQAGTRWPMLGSPDSPLASGTGFIDSSSSDSSNLPQVKPGEVAASNSNPQASVEKRMSQILLAHKAASNVRPDDPAIQPEIERSFSRLSAVRRPPKLNISAVRDAEARGSLTSLPDLIKRATKLAAMIDKGKRPGSRLNNLNDFDDADLAREKEAGGDHLRGSSFSGMLAAFPPPALGTPRYEKASPAWSTPEPSNPKSGKKQSKTGRRCCGLPLWVFLLIMFVTLLIVATAIVVPLYLLVLHKPSPNSSNSAASALAQCQQSMTCSNGGSVVAIAGSCSCICVNGFTGSTCTVASSQGCTMMNINSSNTTYSNVTLGDAIPRLIQQAQVNFSVPLSSDIILARFSSANLSCDTENALVTFDGESERKGSGSSPSAPTTTAAARFARDTPFSTSTTVFTTTISSANIAIASSSTETLTSTVPVPTSTTTFIVTEETLDFARVAVLYILQQQNLATAVAAQSAMATFFIDMFSGRKGTQPANVDVKSGNTVNFVNLSVNVGSGSVGGKGSSGLVSKRWMGLQRIPLPRDVSAEPLSEKR